MTLRDERLLDRQESEWLYIATVHLAGLADSEAAKEYYIDADAGDFSIKPLRTYLQAIKKHGDPLKAATKAKIEVDLNPWCAKIDYFNEAPLYLKRVREMAYLFDQSERMHAIAKAIGDKDAEKVNELLSAAAHRVLSVNGHEPAPAVRRWTVAELYDTEFPEPRWAIPGIIPEGLVTLGGRPKVGKSWLLLQMAAAIGSGGRFFEREVEPGRVLILAFEDNERRLKERMSKMGVPRNAQIEIQTDWKPLHKGGLGDLLIEMERDQYRLIGIDTITRALPGVDLGKDQAVVGMVYDELQSMALAHNQNVTMLDHTRKPTGSAADPIDDIMNMTVKTAICDAVFALYKEQGKAGAVFRGRGRDMEDVALQLMFDPLTVAWQCEGQLGTIQLTEQREAIIDVLAVLGKAQAGDIAKALAADRGNTFRKLSDLANAGKIKREKIGNHVYYENL